MKRRGHPQPRPRTRRLLAITAVFLGIFTAAGNAAESLQNLYHTPAPPPEQVTVFVAKDVVTS